MAGRKRNSQPTAAVAKAQRGLTLPERLLVDVRGLILRTREGVAQAINSALVLLYWQVGQRIRTEVLQSERATYGEEICSTLSNKLAGEFGTGFSRPNLNRQKRIVIDGKDFYIDLLFYHRRLRRLLVIDLKIGAFEAADKGQMELYLRWLEKHERQPGEEPAIGLILCTDKSEEQIELLQLDKSGIRVASYLTELPRRDVLQKKLQDAVLLANARLKTNLDFSIRLESAPPAIPILCSPSGNRPAHLLH